MIKSEKSITKLELDVGEVRKKYLIHIEAKFEAYTGKNLTLWVDKIEDRNNLGVNISQFKFAQILAKELKYNHINAKVEFKLSGHWEENDDDWEVLKKSIDRIYLYVEDNGNNETMK